MLDRVISLLSLLLGGFLTRPRLKFGTPYRDTMTIQEHPLTGTQLPVTVGGTIALSAVSVQQPAKTGSGESADFVYLPVLNKPWLGSKAADAVTARLAFRDEEGTLLYDVTARWAATIQFTQSELTQRPREQTIARTRRPIDGHPLDVAMRYRGEDVTYVFNEENRFRQPDDLRHNPLPKLPVYVEVDVVGANTNRLRETVKIMDDGSGSIRLRRTR